MTDSKPNLILIGLRASGKSTLGVLFAEKLGVGFVDLDDETSRVLGCSGAGEAIEKHGIDAFRDAEVVALGAAIEESGRVISLGGGSPTAPGCSEMLRQSRDRVIYLRALPETLQARLMGTDNKDRPALVGDDVISEVRALFEQRDALYQELAETTIHTDGVSEESVLTALLAVVHAGV